MSLVIVHTEVGYLDPEEMGDTAEQNRALFEKITTEVENRIAAGDRVYYLAEEHDSLERELIYPGIRSHIGKITYIPNGVLTETQFLRAKELALSDTSAEICGVAYDCCILDLYKLFLGEEGPSSTRKVYEMAARYLGWTREKLDSIFEKKMEARILEELTDKVNVGM